MKTQLLSYLRLSPEARGLRGSFCSGSCPRDNLQDFLLITRNATIAPTTSKHITIPATAPPPSLECLPPSTAGVSLPVVLGTAGCQEGGGVFGDGGDSVGVDGGGGGAGPLLNEFPLVL